MGLEPLLDSVLHVELMDMETRVSLKEGLRVTSKGKVKD